MGMHNEPGLYDDGNVHEGFTWSFVKRNIIRGLKFVVAGGTGFFIAELLIFLGLVLLGDPFLLGINIFAAIVSVAGGFIINEYWTSRNEGDHEGHFRGLFFRLIKFELVYALGNVISISVQLFLFYRFAVYPLLGNIAGAVVALPVNYFISMIVVWKIKL